MESRREYLILLSLLLFFLSLTVRLWNVLYIPVFRFDEIAEESRALSIYLGRELPLTNISPFIGAFYNYLIATLYTVSSGGIEGPKNSGSNWKC